MNPRISPYKGGAVTSLATGQSAPVELNHAATCLSGRPLHRLGRGDHAGDGGHDPQRRGARPGSGRWPPPGGFISQSGKRRSRSPALARPAGSGRRPLPGGFAFHVRRTEGTIPSDQVARALSRRRRPLAGSSSKAESGLLESHASRHDPASNRSRRPGRFTLPAYRTSDSNRELRRPERRASTRLG